MPVFARAITPFPAVVPYVGPGDVIPGALGWWGLRAYSQAGIGQNVVRLFRDSDSAELDFATIPGGGLDSGAILTWAGGANLFVVTLYDQTGNGLHMGVSGTMPTFVFGTFPNPNLPAMLFFDGPWLTVSGATPAGSPFTASAVGQETSVDHSYANIFDTEDGNTGLYFRAGPVFNPYPASDEFSIAEATWHDFNMFYDDGSGGGTLSIDGAIVSNTLSVGVATIGTMSIGNDHIGEALTGYVAEAGVWESDQSALLLAMAANQAAFYGYR